MQHTEGKLGLCSLTLKEALTFPKDAFLCTDICLQLCCSYIDSDRLWKMADSLGHNSLGCIPRLKPSSF